MKSRSVNLTYSKLNDNHKQVEELAARFRAASRPLLHLGGELSHGQARALKPRLAALNLPIVTTWNGADRYPFNETNYAGRPNNWGQRSSDIILQ